MRLATFLLYGAGASVGLAWWFSLAVPYESKPSREKFSKDEQAIVFSHGEALGSDRLVVQVFFIGSDSPQSVAESSQREWWNKIDVHKTGSPESPVLQDVRGWPLACVEYFITSDSELVTRLRWGLSLGRFDLGSKLLENHGFISDEILPLKPIWIGLVVDSCLFGLLLFGISSLIGNARRRGLSIRRLVQTAFIWTLVGFATTLVTAWSLAHFSSLNDTEVRCRKRSVLRILNLEQIKYCVADGFGAQRCIRYYTKRVSDDLGEKPPHWSMMRRDWYADWEPWTVTMEDARGWPALCLMWFVTSEQFPQAHLELRQALDARPIGAIAPQDFKSYRIYPLKPIWRGITINTIFYAALLWLLTHGPFTARRMIRRKRGLCIKCGYDLRGTDHDKCPECGIVIKPHLQQMVI